MSNKVLIVDDDDKLRKLVREYLEGHGFQVATLSDGLHVAEKIRDESPDIVILDVMLPGKDGLDVLKEIRTEHSVPVMMLTAKGEDADRIVGLELGADDYLPKPFNPRELLAILIVTEILIFGLFGIIVGRHIGSEMDRYASAQIMMVKEVIESKMRTAPNQEPARNESLNFFIRELGELLSAQVWLQDSRGHVVAKSFPGDLPREHEELKKGRGEDFAGLRFYHGRRRGSGVYAVVPVGVEAGQGVDLHVFFIRHESSHPEGGFALGLGLAIARKVVEVHGGAIWAQSGEEGFRITMKLPRNPGEEGV